MIAKFTSLIDGKLSSIEQRTNLVVTSLIVGTVLLVASSLYVMPKFAISHHGVWYAGLSQDPFNFAAQNGMQFRILTPLIAYILRLPENAFFVLPLCFAVAWLSTIYFHYRRKEYSPSGAAAMAGFIAFSCAIFLPLVTPGYTDVVTYFFLFLSFILVKRPLFFFVVFACAVFNHETALFMAPALIAQAFHQLNNPRLALLYNVLPIAGVTVLYLAYRYYVSQHAQIAFDLQFYFTAANISQNFKLVARLAPIGAFFAFKLFWFIVLAGGIQRIRQKQIWMYLPVLLILGGTTCQILFAFDITRLFVLGFMAVLLSAEIISTRLSSQRFSYYSWMLIGMNFFILQYFVSQEGLNDIFPPLVYGVEHLLKTYM